LQPDFLLSLFSADPLGERDRIRGSFALILFIGRLGCFGFILAGFRLFIVALRHKNPPDCSLLLIAGPFTVMGSCEGCAHGLGAGPQILSPTEKLVWFELFSDQENCSPATCARQHANTSGY
jgi:hypothetical protein